MNAYPDKAAARTLAVGFTKGFRLNYQGARVQRDSKCLPSALRNSNAVRKKLSKEIDAGRVAGPFVERPLPKLQCSPIGIVPKKVPGEFRLIHHLSHPTGSSINDGIPREFCTVEYASFDRAVHLAASNGKGALLAKCDIKSAFRLLPVHPDDFELLGFQFDGKFFFDKALPMGASVSCSLFEKFSSFLEFKVREVTKSDAVLHYLDDFCFVGPPHSKKCSALLSSFQSICSVLGVPLAEEKTEGPSSVITFLGLEIDTITQQVRIPADKLTALKNSIDATLHSEVRSLQSIQSLIGSLNFVTRAIAPGRPFIRRLIDLTKGASKSSDMIRVGVGAKKDLNMWLQFLTHYNGVSLFLEESFTSSKEMQLFTDASGGIGYGAYFQGHWMQDRWTDAVLKAKLSIAFLELYPIVAAVTIWGESMKNKKVEFLTDNKAVVGIINQQTSKCTHIMSLVRSLVLQCLSHNILFKASHVPGVKNSIADSLSRFQMERFRALSPEADKDATQPPEIVWNI